MTPYGAPPPVEAGAAEVPVGAGELADGLGLADGVGLADGLGLGEEVGLGGEVGLWDVLGLADGLVPVVSGEVGLGDTDTDPAAGAWVAWRGSGRLPRPRASPSASPTANTTLPAPPRPASAHDTSATNPSWAA